MNLGHVLLALFPCAAAMAASPARPAPPYFEVKAEYEDGSVITCFAPAKRHAFGAVSPTGAPAGASIDPLPSYVGRESATTIRWAADRGLYVMRAPGWTGELKRLWDRLELPSTEAGAPPTVLPAEGLRELSVRHVRPAKPKGKKR